MSLNKITLLDNEPFKRMVTTVGNLPTSFVDSMSYYEMLAWLCQYVTNTLIPQINLNTEAINEIQNEFIVLQKEVEEAIAEIPQLRADFEALVIRFDETLVELQQQYDAFKVEVHDEIDTQISEARTAIMEVVNAYFTSLDNKIDSEIDGVYDAMENWIIGNTIVFNTLQGKPTTLQIYLDDLAGLNRTDAITAKEYDDLELGAKEYDDKEITAHDYDYFGKTILTA